MQTAGINIPLNFVLDVQKFNVILANLKNSMGDLGNNIKPIDESKLRASLDAIKSSVVQTSATVKTETDKIVKEEEKIGAAGKQAGQKLKEGITGGVSGLGDNLKSAFGTALGVFGGGAIMGGVSGVVGGLKDIFEAGKKSIEATQKLSIAFSQAGLSGEDLKTQLSSTGTFASKLANQFAMPVSQIREFAQTAAAIGGATGKANEDLVKLAVGVERATNGMVSGDMAIRIFSKGVTDPESQFAMGRLTKQFPALASALKGVKEPAESTAKALEFFKPTFNMIEKQALGPIGSMTRFQNSLGAVKTAVGKVGIELISPILETVGSTAVPALQLVVKGVGSVLETVKPLVPLILTGAAAWGAYQLVTLASANASTILGVASNGLKSALTNHPVMIYAAAAVGAIMAIKAISSALTDTAAARLESVKAEEKGIAVQRDANVKRQEELTGSLSLVDTYKELSTKTKLTAEEKEKLKNTTIELNKIYPNTIDSTKSLADNLKNLESKAQQTKNELAKLGAELVGLDKKQRATIFKRTSEEANTLKEDLEKIISDIGGLGGVIASGTEAVLGTSSTKWNAEKFVKPYADMIYKAKDDKQFSEAIFAFTSALYSDDSPVARKNREKALLAFQAFANKQQLLIKAYNNEVDLTNTTQDKKEEKQTEEKTVTKVEAEKRLTAEILKVKRETDKIKRDTDTASIENERNKAIEDNKNKTADEIQAIKDRITDTKNLEKTNNADKIELVGVLNDQIKAVEERGKQSLLALEIKYAKQTLESEVKKKDDILKNEQEIIKKKLERLEFERQFESGDGIISNLQAQSALRIKLIQSEGQAKQIEILSQNATYKQAEDDLVSMQAKFKLELVTEDQVNRAKQALSDISADLLSNNEMVAILANETNRKIAADRTSTLYSIREENLKLITNTAIREREISLLEAEKAYAEEIRISAGNKGIELNAFIKLQEQKLTIEEQYLSKSSQLANFAIQVRNSLMSFKTDTSFSDQIANDRKAIEAEQKEIKRQFRDGEITREDYNKRILESQRKLATNMSLVNEKLWESFARQITENFKKIAEDYQTIAKNAGNQYLALSTSIGNNQKIIADNNSKKSTALAEGNYLEYVKISAQSTALAKDNAKSVEAQQAIIRQSYYNTGAAMAATAIQMLADGKSAAKSAAMTGLAGLKSLIPIFVAEIFGSYASMGPWGLIGAGLTTAALYALMSVAENAVMSAQFWRGGIPEGRRRIVMVNDEPGSQYEEMIMKGSVTAKNKADFLKMNEQNLSLKEHIIRNRPDIIHDLIKDALITQQNEARLQKVFYQEHVEGENLTRNDQALLKMMSETNEKLQILTEEVIYLRQQNHELSKKPMKGNITVNGELKTDNNAMSAAIESARLELARRR